MAEQVRIGVIGAGRIGKLHARNLSFHLSEASVVAVSDVYLDAAKQCAAECRIPKTMQDHREILEDPNVDAIFVCSSTDTHSQMICEGAEAGKHVFCEKPIDFDLDRIDKALAAVEQAGIKLQIGFNRRFDPNFKRARDYVAEGNLGTPHIIRITSRDPESFRRDLLRLIVADCEISENQTVHKILSSEPGLSHSERRAECFCLFTIV